MKTHLSKAVAFLFCIMISVTLFAQEKKIDLTNYAGEWTFKVTDAPYGYENGTASIQVSDGKLSGEFKINGSPMKVNSFKEENGAYSCVVYVDGYPVNVKLHYKDNQLTGTADADDTLFPITFAKVEK